MNTPDTVAVWTTDGIPCRLVWQGIRYQVTDTPTPIRGSILHDLLTHPLEPVIGWRFQGTSAAGDTHVFDVHVDLHDASQQEWRLVAVYD